MPAPKRSALEPSRRKLSQDISFGIGTLLVLEQSSLENRPRGVWYTPLYAVRHAAPAPTTRAMYSYIVYMDLVHVYADFTFVFLLEVYDVSAIMCTDLYYYFFPEVSFHSRVVIVVWEHVL